MLELAFAASPLPPFDLENVQKQREAYLKKLRDTRHLANRQSEIDVKIEIAQYISVSINRTLTHGLACY